MGYFPNGTAGDLYQEEFCNRCEHDAGNDCPIWNAHLLWSGKEGKQDVLDLLIPRSEDGENEQCSMFKADPDWKAGVLTDQKYLEWKRQLERK